MEEKYHYIDSHLLSAFWSKSSAILNMLDTTIIPPIQRPSKELVVDTGISNPIINESFQSETIIRLLNEA